MYTLIGSPKTRALRVLWMLEELEQPYDLVPAHARSDEAKAVNPSGKVPVLMVDGAPLIDSTAIMTFLADRHGALTHPAGSLDRARQDSLTQFVLDELDAVLWTAARHSFVLPKEQRVAEVKDSLKWEFARNLKVLATRMSDGPFLMGAQMTVPDIILTHCGAWAQAAKFPVEEPKVVAYLAAMNERPALLRAQAAQV